MRLPDDIRQQILRAFCFLQDSHNASINLSDDSIVYSLPACTIRISLIDRGTIGVYVSDALADPGSKRAVILDAIAEYKGSSNRENFESHMGDAGFAQSLMNMAAFLKDGCKEYLRGDFSNWNDVYRYSIARSQALIDAIIKRGRG